MQITLSQWLTIRPASWNATLHIVPVRLGYFQAVIRLFNPPPGLSQLTARYAIWPRFLPTRPVLSLTTRHRHRGSGTFQQTSRSFKPKRMDVALTIDFIVIVHSPSLTWNQTKEASSKKLEL